jgi:hypothetical protein
MKSISWTSAGFYCLFGVFLFYQQLHGRNFRGSSQAFGLLLSLSAFIGTLVGIVYLVYYGWNVSWLATIVIFVLGVLAAIPAMLLERLVGAFVLSLLGFVIWPVSAYFMFKYIPSGA